MTAAPPPQPPTPPPAAPRGVLLFRSVHDVMAAEQALQGAGIWCDMVPVPRALSAECGMAIEIRLADGPAVRALRAAAVLDWASAWRVGADGPAPLEEEFP